MTSKAERVLVLAVIIVSSLNFVTHDPKNQETAFNRYVYPFLVDSDAAAKSRSDSAHLPVITDGNIGYAAITTSDAVAPSLPNNLTNIQMQQHAHASNTITEKEDKDDIVWCGGCAYNNINSCDERLKYLITKYQLTEEKARESLMPKCFMDYSTEPYVLLHVGPHKTGTTSIQKFLYNSLRNNATYLEDDKFAIPTFDDLPGIFGHEGPMLNFAHCMLENYAHDGGQMNIAFCNRLRKAFPPFLQKVSKYEM